MAADRLAAALALIDDANAGDPTTITWDGTPGRPLAQVHGQRASEWVRRLDPAAGDAQVLAARAHHLRRWSMPRTDHPEGRAGYLRWRTAAKKRHAEEVAALLDAASYGSELIDRVQQLIRKQGLGTDPAAQTHEDAACLVFLETQLDAVAADLGPERTEVVLRKTARKMSQAGLTAALGLELPAPVRDVLRSVVDGDA